MLDLRVLHTVKDIWAKQKMLRVGPTHKQSWHTSGFEPESLDIWPSNRQINPD